MVLRKSDSNYPVNIGGARVARDDVFSYEMRSVLELQNPQNHRVQLLYTTSNVFCFYFVG